MVLSDEEVINYADGIGLHFYFNFECPIEFLNFATNNVANSTKELFKLATEASNGMYDVLKLMSVLVFCFFLAYLYDVGIDAAIIELGSWTRGDRYLKDIIGVSIDVLID